jgi:hypothetical protein
LWSVCILKHFLACIVTKLRASLFLSASDSFSETVPLVDQGVDSLVGVDIRSWCIKELEVDVPVLKILGGASVIDLSDYILESLPASIVNKATSVEKKGS